MAAFPSSSWSARSSLSSSGLSRRSEQVPLLDAVAVVDEDLADLGPEHRRRVDLGSLLGQQRAVALDRERAGDERHRQDERHGGGQPGGDLRQGPAAEHPPGRAHRLEDGLEEDLVVLLGIPQGRRGVPRDDLGPGVHVRRRQLVADLLGHQAAEGDLLLLRLAVDLGVGGVGLVQQRDDHDLRARLVDVHLQRVAEVRREALGAAGVDQVLARADHGLAEPRQLADQVGPLLDDLLAADGLDHGPAGDLHRHAEPVAAHQPLAVVDHRIGGLLQVERAVDLVREALELVPEPLLRHHLPHLAVLQVGRRQVAQVADEPERALLLRRPPGRVHQDLEQPDDLLVHRSTAPGSARIRWGWTPAAPPR